MLRKSFLGFLNDNFDIFLTILLDPCYHVNCLQLIKLNKISILEYRNNKPAYIDELSRFRVCISDRIMPGGFDFNNSWRGQTNEYNLDFLGHAARVPEQHDTETD